MVIVLLNLAKVERDGYEEIERPTDTLGRQLFVEEVIFQKVYL